MSEQQLNLAMTFVELLPAEQIERGRALADALLALASMKRDHAERRKAMKDDEEKVEEEIAHLGGVVRSGQEERPVGIAR